MTDLPNCKLCGSAPEHNANFEYSCSSCTCELCNVRLYKKEWTKLNSDILEDDNSLTIAYMHGYERKWKPVEKYKVEQKTVLLFYAESRTMCVGYFCEKHDGWLGTVDHYDLDYAIGEPDFFMKLPKTPEAGK